MDGIWTALQAKRETHLVLKKFLYRLIRDVYRAGEPSNGNEIFYDAKIKLSSKSMSAIRSFLRDADSSTTEPLDDALSGILVDITRTRMSLLPGPELIDGGDRGLILAVSRFIL
ncbi:chloride channel CLIC-like protein 1 [Cyprinodon tularosa]|uniref:chloride channel CLIC-like protein 1 n=1 Tax=Cyprinodon tularosa TaxID=77115 RepID=UPI0018E1F200|nr:chloride channel CLIC-like protein 1 [Cyprinodon tularosa]